MRLDPLRDQNRRPSNAIVGEFSGLQELSTQTAIKGALDKKGNRYGIKDTPFLIVIADCKDEVNEDAEIFLTEA